MFLVDKKLASLELDALVPKEGCASLESYTVITMKFICRRNYPICQSFRKYTLLSTLYDRKGVMWYRFLGSDHGFANWSKASIRDNTGRRVTRTGEKACKCTCRKSIK